MNTKERFHTGGVVPKSKKDTEKAVLIKSYSENLNLPNKEVMMNHNRLNNLKSLREESL